MENYNFLSRKCIRWALALLLCYTFYGPQSLVITLSLCFMTVFIIRQPKSHLLSSVAHLEHQRLRHVSLIFQARVGFNKLQVSSKSKDFTYLARKLMVLWILYPEDLSREAMNCLIPLSKLWFIIDERHITSLLLRPRNFPFFGLLSSTDRPFPSNEDE